MKIYGRAFSSVLRRALLAFLLLSCGPTRFASPTSKPITTPTSTTPGRSPLTLARGASLALGDIQLVLEEIVTETIEPAPDDTTAYPSGSGVTVTVTLGGQRGSMSLLSPGYTSNPIAWLAGYRIELVHADDRSAQLVFDRVTERAAATQTIQLRRGETARLHDRVRFEFRGHGHKMMDEGIESPLLVRVAFDGRDHQYALHPPRETTFYWQDLLFTLGTYTYDERMELVVDRLALEPVLGR